jgi:hypothetical protein
MALNLRDQSFGLAGSKTLVTNEKQIRGSIRRPGVVAPPDAAGVVGSVSQVLVLKTDGPVNVLHAEADITASMPEAATLAGAAQVRLKPDDASSVVVDFQSLRTVTELAAPSGASITNIQAWLGTKFDDASVAGFPEGGGNAVTFQELQTERLLVTLDSQVADVDAFAAAASVVIPTPPADLELLVNGVRAWFRQGPVDGSFSATVDVTAPVAAAADGSTDVTVTFRAAAPASLTLDCAADVLLRYPVVFPEAGSRTVDAPTEGVYPLLLPVQAAATPPSWHVRQVILDISAKLPATRVVPADGPPLTGDAELVLDPDHAVVVRLPQTAVSALGVLTGVRLPVVVGPDGAELAGTLRAADGAGEPGDAIPKGALGPVTLEASANGDATWIDLALATQHPLAGADPVWLEVQAARGTVVWKLALPAADADDDAPLRRRTSNGKYVALSALESVSYTGAIRVVGQQRPNDPLAAVLVAPTGAAVSGTVAGVPTQGGTALALVLDPAVSFTPDGRDFSLDLTISAPGSYAVSSAELQYTTR